jgi:hypothetical protein
MKVYCRPSHIVDTHINFFCLEGAELSIRRFYIPMTMILNEEAFVEMNGFEEVTPEEFDRLAQIYASIESVEKFEKEYSRLYKNP